MSKHPFLLRSTMAAILVLLLAGCSGGDNTPSESGIQSAVSKFIHKKEGSPDFRYKVKIDIKAQENEGSKTEPEFHTRFVATVVTAETLYEGKYTDGKIVLKKTVDKGEDIIKLSGVTVSTLKGEQWETNITKLDPLPDSEQPNAIKKRETLEIPKPLSDWDKKAKRAGRQVVVK